LVGGRAQVEHARSRAFLHLVPEHVRSGEGPRIPDHPVPGPPIPVPPACSCCKTYVRATLRWKAGAPIGVEKLGEGGPRPRMNGQDQEKGRDMMAQTRATMPAWIGTRLEAGG